jgi:hypothetical protein
MQLESRALTACGPPLSKSVNLCDGRYVHLDITYRTSSNAPNLLSNVFSTSGLPRSAGQNGGGISLKPRPAEPFVAPVQFAPRKRTPIFEMHRSVHCSIIGTCLPVSELRRLLIKLGVPGAASDDDHALHKQAVALAARPHDGGKLIHKTLDRRHEAAIRQCAKLVEESELLRHWEDALARGDIPGPYWAILSHPAATDAVMRRVFGDVHMLSHMVGAANRADIRRLRQLEDANTALAAEIESQQRHLRDGFATRDASIRLLKEALSRALAQSQQAPASTAALGEDAAATREAFADLGDEGRLRELLAGVEAQIRDALVQGAEPRALATLPQLDRLSVLFVGGRAHQMPQLKGLVERLGGVLLYHDGGIEHATAMLPGLVSRADCAAVPVDCVSHHAMATVKRLCRQAGKPFMSLRSSGLASLLAGLVMFLVLYLAARWMTQTDPQWLRIVLRSAAAPVRYDPATFAAVRVIRSLRP